MIRTAPIADVRDFHRIDPKTFRGAVDEAARKARWDEEPAVVVQQFGGDPVLDTFPLSIEQGSPCDGRSNRALAVLSPEGILSYLRQGAAA